MKKFEDNEIRLTQKAYPAAAAEDVDYTYDQTAGGNKGKGRLTGIADQTGSTAFVYDARGNVTKETRTIYGKSHVILYAYDLADRLTQITYPSGRIVIYARDVNGRITGVTTRQNATAPVVTVASSIVYQPMSNLVQSFAAGNGLTTLNTYTQDIVPEARLRHDELDLLGVYMPLARLRQDGPAERRMRSGHPKAQPWVIERTHSRTAVIPASWRSHASP